MKNARSPSQRCSPIACASPTCVRCLKKADEVTSNIMCKAYENTSLVNDYFDRGGSKQPLLPQQAPEIYWPVAQHTTCKSRYCCDVYP